MRQFALGRRGLLSGIGVALVGALGFGTDAAEARRPDRHIVGTSTPAAAEAAAGRAESVHRVLDFGDVGTAVAGRFSPRALTALRRNPNVRYVEADGQMNAVGIDSPDGEVPWGVDRVDAEKAHADGATGLGADVCILDTGIDSDHPDLRANLGTGRAFVSADGSYAEPWDDDNGHGTHCAGIAGAVADESGVVGVSTEATLHAVKVLDGGGSGTYSDVAAGIEWVTDRGYDVASMSLGGPTSRTIEDACRYAAERGVLVVAAAGNDGGDVGATAPAAYSTAVAVGATDDRDRLADFSNTGPEVELAAPGVDITSTLPGGYGTYSGTSMACPHVSGAAGQLIAAGYGPEEARARLGDTAEDVGLSSDEQGNGLLDVEAAVSGSADATPTVSWANPAADETVSGTVAVRIDAGDAEDDDDALTVTYSVDGGGERAATYDGETGYYEASWDSTLLSDGDHTLTARATDAAGNTGRATVAVVTDNAAGDAGAPTVDAIAIAEDNGGGNPHADFVVSWTVSDGAGDLSGLELTLADRTTGEREAATSVAVSGGTASGTTQFKAKHEENSGHEYAVEAVVTDERGDTATATATEVEDGQ